MWMFFALCAAGCFGLRGALYHWTSQQPMNRNLMLFGVFVTGALVSTVLVLLSGQQFSYAAMIGMFMGMFSFAANASMYRGFAVGKASVIAIFTSLPPVVVVSLAYVIWHESLTLWQLCAFIVILTGVLLIRYSGDWAAKGIGWGILTMLFFGFNDLTSKQSTILEADLYPTLFYMFTMGSLLFGLSWLVEKKRSAHHPPVADGERSWKPSPTFLWGMLVGTTNISGMIFIMQAFQVGITGLVSAVVSLNVLLILVYTRLYTKERFTLSEITGILFCLSGVFLLRTLS
ncbi:EamA family transporter [Marinicrinis sediminis]|uniref:EamA family transporter n=1 Tax=Marinicrinis sediminis TaxID=1652465 RepID=A0ABW5REQ3_9BACL